MIEIINGNLFDSKEKYIAHQCNCVSKKAAHLSFDMFNTFPYSNIYKNRTVADIPGTILIKGNGTSERYIINMFGQIYPGKKYPDSLTDGKSMRQKYFFSCLKEIALIQELNSIAFPFGIGCGAAGGNWEFYYNLLEKFAAHIKNTKVILYKYENG